MTVDEQLDFFDESLRRLKVKYDMFFAGSMKTPPSVERQRLDALMHEMSRVHIRDNARRFRFNTLLGRYNQFRELWGRRMREREEGPLEFKRRTVALAAAAKHREPLPDAPPPEKPPLVTSTPDDSYVRVARSSEGDALQQLYSQISDAQSRLGGASKLTYEQVTAMVQKQAETLRARFGVETIAFRVETVNGKVKLKAKPV